MVFSLRARAKIIGHSSKTSIIKRQYTTRKAIENLQKNEIPLTYNLYLSQKDLINDGILKKSIGKLTKDLMKPKNSPLIPKVLLSAPLPLTASKDSKKQKADGNREVFNRFITEFLPFDETKVLKEIGSLGKTVTKATSQEKKIHLFSSFIENGYPNVISTESDRLMFFAFKVLRIVRGLLEDTVKTNIFVENHHNLKFPLSLLGTVHNIRRCPDLALRFQNLASMMIEVKQFLPKEIDHNSNKISKIGAFDQVVEYMLIERTPYGVITNSRRTICLELDHFESLKQTTGEVKLVFKSKVLRYDDPLLTKIGFFLW